LVWVSALCFFQRDDTVGLVTRTSRP